MNYNINNLFVTLNGLTLRNGVDYLQPNTSYITLTSGANANDELSIVAFGSFNVQGQNTQNTDAIAIGDNAGYNYQSDDGIAIGTSAGYNFNNSNGWAPIAIGRYAGEEYSGHQSIAIGSYAGNSGLGYHSVAIGHYAASNGSGQETVAVGDFAGQGNPGQRSVAIGAGGVGYGAGDYSVAIGYEAGWNDFTPLGLYQVAIGAYASAGYGYDNSIVLNASGSTLDATASGLFIKPVRNFTHDGTTDALMFYNDSTGEVRYSSVLDGGSF